MSEILNAKRELERRFNKLRDRFYGKIVRGPYEIFLGTGTDPSSPPSLVTGNVWAADVVVPNAEKVLEGIPIAGVNKNIFYANSGQSVVLETIRGRLAITGKAEQEVEEEELICFDEDGTETGTDTLGIVCTLYTLGELGDIPAGGFGITTFQPTKCVDRFGNQTTLGG